MFSAEIVHRKLRRAVKAAERELRVVIRSGRPLPDIISKGATYNAA